MPKKQRKINVTVLSEGDAGYKKYDMYIKRAKTFIGMEYYNNAIEDLTSAISLNATTSAYLLRGKVKL